MGTSQDDLSGLASQTGQATPVAAVRRPMSIQDDDDDPFGTGNPNLADTRANLLAHGINPDLRIPDKRA